MKLINIFKNKRGIAIENAILFMILIFSLCALLTSLTLIGHLQVKLEKNTLLRQVELDQIGEDYLSCLQSGDSLVIDNEKYAHEIRGNALHVWLKNDDKQTVVLYVEAEYTDGLVHVYRWSPTLPPDIE